MRSSENENENENENESDEAMKKHLVTMLAIIHELACVSVPIRADPCQRLRHGLRQGLRHGLRQGLRHGLRQGAFGALPLVLVPSGHLRLDFHFRHVMSRLHVRLLMSHES